MFTYYINIQELTFKMSVLLFLFWNLYNAHEKLFLVLYFFSPHNSKQDTGSLPMLQQMVKVCLTVKTFIAEYLLKAILYHIIFSHKGTKINSCSLFCRWRKCCIWGWDYQCMRRCCWLFALVRTADCYSDTYIGNEYFSVVFQNKVCSKCFVVS